MDVLKFKEMMGSFHHALANISEEVADRKLSEDQWSLKEIVGHLTDSASNNHQRFVRLQFGDLLDFPGYDAEQWVRNQKYRDMEWEEITSLWYSYNCMLLKVVGGIEGSVLQNVWVKDEDALSLEYLINDYYDHMAWHISHFKDRLVEVSK